MDTILRIESLTKIYGTKATPNNTLNSITFQVMPREFLGFMGSSGSGKSTLLNCIATVIHPSSGNIFCQIKVKRTKRKRIADYRGKQVGCLFQNFELLANPTARENILLPTSLHNMPEAKSKRQLYQLVAYLRITDVLSPTQMSGGQRQRITAARALHANHHCRRTRRCFGLKKHT